MSNVFGYNIFVTSSNSYTDYHKINKKTKYSVKKK